MSWNVHLDLLWGGCCTWCLKTTHLFRWDLWITYLFYTSCSSLSGIESPTLYTVQRWIIVCASGVCFDKCINCSLFLPYLISWFPFLFSLRVRNKTSATLPRGKIYLKPFHGAWLFNCIHLIWPVLFLHVFCTLKSVPRISNYGLGSAVFFFFCPA